MNTEMLGVAMSVLDLSPLGSEASKVDSLRELGSSLLNKAHIVGVSQEKVAKDRRPALSRGWGLDMETAPNTDC